MDRGPASFLRTMWVRIDSWLTRRQIKRGRPMDTLKKLSELHDYVKKNYEQGHYDDVKKDYQNWSQSHDYGQEGASTTSKTDFQMGYDQAMDDFKTGRPFRRYPDKLVDLGNSVFGNKLEELSAFIKGYREGQQHSQP